ncbi:MAG: alpha/beta hydrolase [Verrucomicrobia bacterium]|nr:alpha/beta hydrolase [Verrucomicrobiota bacterium]
MNSPIRNSYGERLEYAYHEADGARSRRIVLIGHGVTGNMDRPWAVALAGACAGAGIDALRFSFAGNGRSQGLFTDATITKEVGDLGSVIDALPGGRYDEIVYAGHSMGGAVGVLRAAFDPRLSTLISLAGMVHTARFVEEEFGGVVPDEGLMWDKPDCLLSSAYLADLRAIGSVLDQAAAIKVPWLFVHGAADDVIPITEGREIFAAARDPKQMIELPDADHVFSEAACAEMTRAVTGFLS